MFVGIILLFVQVGTGAVQSEVKSTPAVISIPETPVYEDPRLADPSKVK